MSTTKVVIIGGGISSITLAKSLAKEDVEIFFISKNNYHFSNHLLPLVATGALCHKLSAHPLREIFSKQSNIHIILGEVISLDLEKKIIQIKNETLIGYDYLVIATGETSNNIKFPSIPTLSTLSDAIRIKKNLIYALEMADQSSSMKKHLSFTIIGDDIKAIEYASILAEQLKSLLKKYPKIKHIHPKIFLVDYALKLLSNFPEHISDKIKMHLEKKGVNLITDKSKNFIDEKNNNTVFLGENKGADFLSNIKLPINKKNKLIVDKDLSIPGHPEIFAIGNAAYFLDLFSPFSINTKKLQAKFVSNIIKKGIPKHTRPTFKVSYQINLATLGRLNSVFMINDLELFGFVPWVVSGCYYTIHTHSILNKIRMALFWFFPPLHHKNHLLEQSIDDMPTSPLH